MSGITFDDGSSATLTNGLPMPGARLKGFTPLTNPVGPLSHALGSGIPYMWEHRTDEGAEFTITFIDNADQGIANRLTKHLLKGGSVELDTGLTVYANCYIWPGSKPKLSPPNPQDLKRTYAVSLLNGDGEPMEAPYA